MTPSKVVSTVGDVKDVKDITYSPNEAANNALAMIQARKDGKDTGVRLGIECIDRVLNPLRASHLCGVIGRTSNFKTGFMQWWARSIASQLIASGSQNEAVFYVTLEQALEELLVMDLALTAGLSATDIYQGRVQDSEMEKLKSAAFRRASVPLWIIGHSVREGKRRPKLTLTVVGRALQFVEREFGLKPKAIFLDYLQLFQVEEGEFDYRTDRRGMISTQVERAKNMAGALQCPVILGSQARRDEYGGKWGVPSITGSMETSSFEQASDVVLGVWLPKTNLELGSYIDLKWGGYTRLEVTKNLLIVQLLKQRMGDVGNAFPLYVDLSRNQIGEMSMKGEEEPF